MTRICRKAFLQAAPRTDGLQAACLARIASVLRGGVQVYDPFPPLAMSKYCMEPNFQAILQAARRLGGKRTGGGGSGLREVACTNLEADLGRAFPVRLGHCQLLAEPSEAVVEHKHHDVHQRPV